MKRKGLFCAVLALLLLFCAQPAALAAAGSQWSTEIEAECRVPNIRVTVPTRGLVYINPFSLPVAMGGEDSTEQIISSPAAIANLSEVPVEVNVTVLGEIKAGSTMTLASAPTGGSGTVKEAFIYFEIQRADSPDVENVAWASGYDPAKHVAVAAGTSQVKESIVTLSARASESEAAAGGYGPFRLAGDAVKHPADEWTNGDGVSVTVAFTFTPIPYR